MIYPFSFAVKEKIRNMAKFSDITFTGTDVIKFLTFVITMATVGYKLSSRLDYIEYKQMNQESRIDALEKQAYTQSNKTDDLLKWRWQRDAVLSKETKVEDESR